MMKLLLIFFLATLWIPFSNSVAQASIPRLNPGHDYLVLYRQDLLRYSNELYSAARSFGRLATAKAQVVTLDDRGHNRIVMDPYQLPALAQIALLTNSAKKLAEVQLGYLSKTLAPISRRSNRRQYAASRIPEAEERALVRTVSFHSDKLNGMANQLTATHRRSGQYLLKRMQVALKSIQSIYHTQK